MAILTPDSSINLTLPRQCSDVFAVSRACQRYLRSVAFARMERLFSRQTQCLEYAAQAGRTDPDVQVVAKTLGQFGQGEIGLF